MTAGAIGFSADLRPNKSIHTKAFCQAVDFASHSLLQRYDIKPRIIKASDDASMQGAVACARQFVDEGVKFVIGHFASPAARSACEIYSENNITVLLPAATDPMLSEFKQCYQICPDDDLQVKAIIRFIEHCNAHNICIMGDQSEQNNSLSKSLFTALRSKAEVTKHEKSVDLTIFIGRYDSAINYLQCSTARTPVLFSDDVKHHGIFNLGSGAKRDLYFLGFNYSYSSLEHVQLAANKFAANVSSGQTYFLETVAAAQIAFLAINTVEIRDLNNMRWNTLLGDVFFKCNKNIFSRYSIWKFTENQFRLEEPK